MSYNFKFKINFKSILVSKMNNLKAYDQFEDEKEETPIAIG